MNHQIFDHTFKRVLTLSNKAIINLINGMFETDYPIDSKIVYNWTEHTNKELEWKLADTILTINDICSYHIEAQMTEDEEIVFRVFEYGFGHAYQNRIVRKGGETMVFPEPRILYLSDSNLTKIPQAYHLTLDFGTQGQFIYEVPVVKILNFSIEELNKRKMVILIPFYLLKLRKELKKARTKDNMNELQKLILYDIIGSINENKRLGNISQNDSYILTNLTQRLYFAIYSTYEELEEVSMRIDQSLHLECDKYNLDEMEETIQKQQDKIKENEDIIKEQGETIKEQGETIKALEKTIKEQSKEQGEMIRSLTATIEELKAQLK